MLNPQIQPMQLFFAISGQRNVQQRSINYLLEFTFCELLPQEFASAFHIEKWSMGAKPIKEKCINNGIKIFLVHLKRSMMHLEVMVCDLHL